MATISAANVIPGKIAPKEFGGNISEGETQGKMPPKLTQEQLNKLLTKLEFKRPESVGWSEADIYIYIIYIYIYIEVMKN